MTNWQEIIDNQYLSNPQGREILLLHSRQVAEMALQIAHAHALPLTDDEIVTAAMLHDVGICLTHAPAIGCHGQQPYICHGLLGADLLRSRGVDEKYARVAERHTGAGLTADDIRQQQLPLPLDRVYMPQTDLELLICYADKFFSKSPLAAGAPCRFTPKSIEAVRRSMQRHGPDTLARFDAMHQRFAI